MKEEGEKLGLKLNIQKSKITATGPITSWQKDREIMETVTDFIVLGSTIMADGDCNHEIKGWLFLGREAMTNLDCILKSRHYFADKSPCSQSYGFSSTHVWMWELDHKEGWALKNWCFWNVVWRRLLRVPCTARRSNQSILKEINPEYWLERLMLNCQYFGYQMRNGCLTGKDPDAGNDWRQEEKGMTEDEMFGWHHWLSCHVFEQAPGDGEGQGRQ